MPRKCPDKFRAHAVTLVRSGQAVTKTAEDRTITVYYLYGWQSRVTMVVADHSAHFTSWALTKTVTSAGLMPSFTSIGKAVDKAMKKSFLSLKRDYVPIRKR